MAKIILNDVGDLTSFTTAVAVINANSAAIETAMEKTLSRDGTQPNTMSDSLDMNSNQILNLPAPSTSNSPLRLQDLSTFTGGGTLSTNQHLVIFTIAPFGATTADKSKADFVGDGVNDQVAVNAAVTAARAISNYSKVVMLPGVYNFSAAASLGGVPGGNGFIFEARGTLVNGPGVGGAATALDTFVINNSNFSEFNFGSIKTKNTGTAAAIHSTGNYSETKITWQALDGTARGGYGFYADTTSAATSQSVNWITATHVQNFAKGIVLSSVGAGANVDTWRITVDYIYNNVVGCYVHSATGGILNSNVWNINIDASNTAADIGFQTNSNFDVINATIGGLAAGSHNIVFDSGATANTLNLTPISLAVAAGSILDNSTNLTNTINGSIIDGFLNGLNQLVKYDGATNGSVSRTGLTLGSIGTINTLAWFPSSGSLASLATANSGILVTSSGGVPSISSTLPAYTLGGSVTGVLTLNTVSGHSIGAASPGLGWGLYHAGNLNATAGVAVNWQTDAVLIATANNDILQGMRITSGTTKGAFTGVVSTGLYIAGGAGGVFDFGIRVNDTSPVFFGGTLTVVGSALSTGPVAGIGYGVGAGGTVTQITSRATGVTLNKVSGDITLFSVANAAVSGATAVTITVTNSAVAALDTIHVSQKSGADKYLIFVTNVAAGSFQMTWYTTGGVTNEAPVFHFNVIKGVSS